MLDYLEQLLIVLAIGSAVAIGAKRISVPYNVALVVVGLLLVLMDVLPDTPMNPSVVMLVFLPILIFQGALSADGTSMRQAARPILALAVPGVALSLRGHGGHRVVGDRLAVLGGAAARRGAGHHRHGQRAARLSQRSRSPSARRDHGRREPVQRRHGAGPGQRGGNRGGAGLRRSSCRSAGS